jgi:hypothetical protein
MPNKNPSQRSVLANSCFGGLFFSHILSFLASVKAVLAVLEAFPVTVKAVLFAGEAFRYVGKLKLICTP